MARPKAERLEFACVRCGGKILATPNAAARGRNRYCDPTCYHADRVGKSRGPYTPRPAAERSCAACGKTFLVGGRGNASRHQKLCSIDCQRLARHRSSGAACSALSEANAAYIAGIIDGEGSVMLVTRKGENSGAYLRVSISNTHRPMLEWVASATGIGTVHDIDNVRYGRSTKMAGCWKTHGEPAASLLRQILPYLIIKRKQAEFALEFQERLLDPAMLADKAWQLEWMARMKEMNRRGTRPKPEVAE